MYSIACVSIHGFVRILLSYCCMYTLLVPMMAVTQHVDKLHMNNSCYTS